MVRLREIFLCLLFAYVFEVFCNGCFWFACLLFVRLGHFFGFFTQEEDCSISFLCPGEAPALHPPSGPPGIWGDTLTRQQAAQDLHPHADAPVVEPGLWVYANVAGHHGDRQLVENRDLLFMVPFKDLFTHKGERRTF